ncbi:MAG: hypothetical protein ONA90_05195 [candidate division KSB1 bacterium]|nr:hypothetical protein [candidate division KSB1 bacterium]
MPQLFRDNPHAAALRISNTRGEFLGAMYDARRIGAEEYKNFLAQKDPLANATPYEFYLWESKGRKLRIAVLSLRRMQFRTYLARMAGRYLGHIAVLYLVVGAMLFWLFAAFQHKSIKLARKPPAASAAPEPPRPHAWHNRPGALAENSIRAVLRELCQMAGAVSAALFIRRINFLRSRWEGFLELCGGLWIRGEGMTVPVPNFPDTVRYYVSPDQKKWYFADPEFAFCFGLALEKPSQPEPALRDRILQRIEEGCTLLAKELGYETAILDRDGLFTAPYALFCLKERLLCGRAFAAALVKTALLDPTAIRTAIRVLRHHFSSDCAPLIASFGQGAILVVFSQKVNSTQAEQAVCALFSALVAQGKNPACGFAGDCVLAGNTEQVLRRLELLAKRSAQTGKVEKLVLATPAQIL